MINSHSPSSHLRILSGVCIAGCSALLFTSCASDGYSSRGSLYDPGYGPFDSKGNYLTSEADKPARQKRRPRNSRESIANTSQVKEKKKTTTTTKVYTSPPQPIRTVTQTTSQPKPKVVVTPKPKPVAAVKPKPKPTVKVAPKIRYHSVKKGDTLYGISRQYNTTVSSIQKLNRLSGTTIRVGQSLKVPN